MKKEKFNLNKFKNVISLILVMFSLISIFPLISASLTDGLTHYYDFENETAASTNVIEVVFGIDNGTTQNMEAGDWTPGKVGEGIRADGVNEYITLTGWTETQGTNYTFNFWVNTTDSTLTQFWDFDTPRFALEFNDGSDIGFFTTADGAKALANSGTSNYNDGTFKMITILFNDTVGWLYVNGTRYSQATFSGSNIGGTGALLSKFDGSANFFNGTVDEFGFWNRTLSESEISSLWNSSNGATYPFTASEFTLDISLTNPSNNTEVQGISNYSFTASYTVTLGNLTNSTLYIWNSTNGIHATNFTTITGTSNTTNISISNFTSSSYHWNYYTCAENASNDIICSFADNNRTFEILPFETNSQYYVTDVLETSNQYFNISITTIENILSVETTLKYNGTSYIADTECDGANCVAEIYIDIPIVEQGEYRNKSFNWEIDIFDGTNSYTFELDTLQQNVSRIYLLECNGTYKTQALNFTAYDEQNLTIFDTYDFKGTFEYWLGGGDERQNISLESDSLGNVTLCISPNRTYYHTSHVKYTFENENLTYVPRDYYFENATFNNVSQDIPLYLLLNTESTTFILEAQDETLGAIQNALILTQKFYPGEGIYRTVQVGRTDENGKTVGFFEAETVEYKFIGIENGEIIFTEGPRKVFGESVPYTITFQVSDEVGTPWIYYEGLENLVSNLSYNSDLKMFYFTYVDTSGTLSSARLLVEKQSPIGNPTTICNISTILASATLTAIETFGRLGLFLGTIVIMAGYAVAIFNISAGLLVGLAITILLNLTPIISLPLMFIFAQIALTIFILVAINKR